MKTETPILAQYELRQRLRQNGTSEVWRAYDNHMQRPVLIKIFRTKQVDTAAILERYVRNVERIASLRQPNIVPIHDIHVLPPSGKPVSLVYLAMHYIEGESFAEYMLHTSFTRKIPSSSEVVNLFSSLALTIDTLHQQGIVHGNLKPSNILLDLRTAAPGKIGTPLLTDFDATRFPPGSNGHDIPSYLAPEQIRGNKAEKSSDIYALGTILYELYTGTPPFRGNRPIAIMMQHINAQPTPPDLVNPTISPAVTQVIMRCLAKDPQKRFPSASALVVALAQALHVEVPAELRRSLAVSGTPVPTALPDTPVPIRTSPSGRKYRKNPLAITTIILLLLLLIAGYGTFLLAIQKKVTASSGPIGHAYFINSGHLNENSNQGINDELQIDLSNMPDPAPGHSYYAWLLSDNGQTETIPLAIGRLTLEHGAVHLLYTDNGRSVNLLGLVSRFLITEDDARNPSSNPLLDQTLWRYYAAIPQTPNAADKLHFSMLDHLRHLLVESPELTIRGMHGGLAFWFARNAATISDMANTLADDWQKQDASTIQTQLARILEYLDGTSSMQNDIPPAIALPTDTRTAQVALLGTAPQDADPPGYVFQNEAPPGYVYLIEAHMNGAILSPQTTTAQHQLAIQVTSALDSIKQELTQITQDARQLIHQTQTQLLQNSALTLLDDIATQAQYAYTGYPDPAKGSTQGGTLWLYNSLQRLATFDVTAYH